MDNEYRKKVLSGVADFSTGMFSRFPHSRSKVFHFSGKPGRSLVRVSARNSKELDAQIKKYIAGSCPKIGWDSEVDINHIRLVELIAKYNFGLKREIIHDLFSEENLNNCKKLIHEEFHGFLSSERIFVLNRYLERRIEEIRKVI